MKDILELIVKSLVDNTEEITIKETQNDKFIIYQVRVASEDMGRVIGRQGKIVNSIRSIMKAVASREHKMVKIEFLD